MMRSEWKIDRVPELTGKPPALQMGIHTLDGLTIFQMDAIVSAYQESLSDLEAELDEETTARLAAEGELDDKNSELWRLDEEIERLERLVDKLEEEIEDLKLSHPRSLAPTP